ncbi:hypothetical protein GW756_05700 [bacterium]|nr:hypothetical protein [bacterium]NCQ55914.1 hypothetical protein [Candidatus Parcubacteria bacterium]NCS67939.1 hypothetical protein [Candidatus Peregrinibacteria bacterium]NCS96833.1 hypothetical protein [bacterium]
MNSVKENISEAITQRGISEVEYLDDGFDSHVFRGTIKQREVLLKAYHDLKNNADKINPREVLGWYLDIGKKVRSQLEKTPNPLGQKLEVDGKFIQMEYECADFGMLVEQDGLLISVVRHPIAGNSLAKGISGLGLQDFWSETPPSDIERKIVDLANSTLLELATRLNFPGQKLDPTNLKLKYDNKTGVLKLIFTDIYARILKAYQ